MTTITSKYAAVHEFSKLNGPGDDRPTAQQIIDDNNLRGQLKGKVAFITGCSSGIGIETARALKSTGATVYVTARDLDKGKKALSDILEPGSVELLELDLNSLASVEACAKKFLSRSSILNILINNAGIMALPQRETTTDGFEAQLGVNHLAPFLLFQRLKPTLLASATPDYPSRVVNLSSVGHTASGIIFNDLQLEKPGTYNAWLSYGQSKTATIYMANEIERRYGSKHLHAFSLHPGGIWTGLQVHVDTSKWEGKPEVERMMKSAEQGAATTIWAAVDKDLKGKGGLYLDDCQVAKPSTGPGGPESNGHAEWIYDVEPATHLWEESCKLVNVQDD